MIQITRKELIDLLNAFQIYHSGLAEEEPGQEFTENQVSLAFIAYYPPIQPQLKAPKTEERPVYPGQPPPGQQK